MDEKAIVTQMVDAISDLETLTDMASIVPLPPDDIEDGISLVKMTWRLGRVFKEHALAMIARSSIENTFKNATRVDGACAACGYVYEDIEAAYPPLTCSRCSLVFDEIPLKRSRIRRYKTWEQLESKLMDELDISHGVIGQRITLYKRMLAIEMTWQQAYDAVLKSPTYCEHVLAAFEWNSRGTLVRVPDSAIIPVEIKDQKGQPERIEMASDFLRERILSETAIIDDRFTKSAMIQNAREMSGRPTVSIYRGNPHNSFELVAVISQAVDTGVAVEKTYRIKLYDESGEVESLPRDISDALIKELSVKNPPPALRRTIWTSDELQRA